MAANWRLQTLRHILGGELSADDDGQRLLLRHAVRNGCGGIFALFWLWAFTFASISVSRSVVAHPDLRGILVAALVVAIELAVAIYVLACLAMRDDLRMEYRRILYQRRVIFVIRQQELQLAEIQNIDLFDMPQKARSKRGNSSRQDNFAININGGDTRIFFGQGLSRSTLVKWAHMLRARIEQKTHHPLPSAPLLDQIEAQLKEHNQQIMNQALQNVGANSVEELQHDAQRQKQLAQQVKQLVIAESMQPQQPAQAASEESIARKVGGFLAMLVWCAVGILWIISTIGLTISAFKRSGMVLLFFLPIFWAISLLFALILFASTIYIRDIARNALRQMTSRK
jgi:hypothetical protein